jgi:alpha-tubulin suppressor-like RCC1 family protein
MLSKLYFYLRDKIQELELHLSSLIQKRLAVTANSRLFYFSAIYLNLKLVLFEILSDLVKFLVIVFADPAEGFKLFYNQRDLQACPYSYSGFRQVQRKIRIFSFAGIASIVTVAVITSLITNLLFGGKLPSFAAGYGWTQSSWSGNASTTANGSHYYNRDGQTPWDKYYAKSSTLTATNSIQLLAQSATTTQTTDGDWALGTGSGSVKVTGTGTPSSLTLNSAFRKISNSSAFGTTLALKSDGTVWAWGKGTGGELGNGANSSSQVPVQVSTATGMTNVVDISAAFYHSAAVTASGTVWVWGDNNNYQFGNGTNNSPASSNVPVQVPGLSNIVAIDGSQWYLVALAADGTVYTWGNDFYGRTLGRNAIGYVTTPTVVTGISNVKMISVSSHSSVYTTTWALKNDGTIWRWGDVPCVGGGGYAYLPAMLPNATYSNVISIGAAGMGMVLLQQNGTVRACAWSSSAAITGQGAGSGISDATVAIPGLSNIVSISTGVGNHVFAMTATGTVYGWGSNNYRQVSSSTASTTIYSPMAVPELQKPSLFYAGDSISFVASSTGALYAWGRGDQEGVLGDNAKVSRTTPVPVYNNFNIGLRYAPSIYSSPIIDLNQNSINNSLFLSFDRTLNGAGSNAVGFLVATSSSASGPWNYYGPTGLTPADCSGAGCYNASSSVAGSSNARFARYKAFILSSDQIFTPSLDEVRLGRQFYPANNQLVNLRFEDGTGTIAIAQQLFDSSGNGYHATSSVASSSFFTGQVGQAANLGGQSINGYNFVSRPLPAFTVSSWFRTNTSIVGNQGTIFAFGRYDGVTQVAQSGIGLSSGMVQARVVKNGSYPWGTMSSPAATYNDGQWHQAVLTFDSNAQTANLYVDGALASTSPVPANLDQGIGFYRLGGGTGAHWGSFSSTSVSGLDEVQIYDRPLSAVEVAKLYADNNPSPVLTGSWYNSTDDKNIISRISWSEDVLMATGTRVKIQLRTASSTDGTNTNPATTTATSWQGVDGTSGSYFSSLDWTSCSKVASTVTCQVSATSTIGDGNNDRWVQYRVILESAGDYTPTVDDINLQYVVNNPPDIQANSFSVAQSTTTGQVEMAFAVRDSDTDTGNPANRFKSTISLEYWNGSAWAIASSSLLSFSAGSSTVAVATDTYAGYQLIWDAANEPGLSPTSTANLSLRLKANDGELANNLGYATTSILLDTVKPNAGSIVVKGNVRPAEVTLSATDFSSFKMKVSVDPTFSDVADWVDYNSTTSISVSSSTANVYAIYRDNYNNISTTSVELPITPTIVMIQDTSNVKVEPAEYRLFLSWKRPSPANFKSYNIYRTYDATNTLPTLIGSSTLYNINYFTDSNDMGMASGTDVWYFVSLETVDGNVSYLSDPMWGNADGTQNRGEGGGGLGNGSIPPTITNISTTTYANQAVIEWDTDIVSDSLVFYSTELPPGNDWSTYTATSTGVSTLLDNQAHYGRHRVTISDLIPGQTYYYKVQSMNVNDMSGYVFMDAQSQPLSFTTQTGAMIMPGTVEVISLTNTTANIAWTTDPDSVINTITYATSTDSNGNLINPITSDPGLTNVNRHLIKLSGLEPGKTYLFYARSDNSVDKNTVNAEDRYFQLTTTRDVAAPYISIGSADVTPTDHSVIIQFATDKPATSTVVVSAGLFSTSSESSSFNSSNHYMFEGLTPATSYNILITATDQNGNTGATSSSFITNAAPDTAGPTMSTSTDWLAPSPNRAVITFYTNDEPGTGYVEYANGTSSFETNKLEVGSDQLSNTHVINLAGLAQNQTYYFRLRSSDASGNVSYSPAVSTSEFYSFTTVPGPTISNISTSTTETSATISWHTSENADGYVIYGTPNLTSSLEKGNPAKVLDRTVTINGLTPGTTYQFKLKSTNESNGISVYPDGTTLSFTTDLGPLTISNATTSSVTDQSAVVTWNTTRAAQSIIYYGTTSRASGTLDQIAADSIFTTSPTVILSGLSSSTTYYFQIVNTDNLGRIATSTEEYLFTTKEPQHGQSEVDLLQAKLDETLARLNKTEADLAKAKAEGGGGGVITITKTIDKRDLTAPLISDIQVEAVTATSAKVTWVTDEEANSIIKYGSGDMDMDRGDFALTKAHQSQLYDLRPDSNYSYRIYSADSSGNLAKSEEFSFTTKNYSANEALGLGSTSPDQAITPELVQSAAAKMVDLLTGLSNTVSLGSFETTIVSQFDALNRLASIIPGPVLGGEPATEITPSTVTIRWKTDKQANSMIAYAPEILFAQSKGAKGYLQLVGEPNQLVTDHTVKIVGLKPDTTYHYQLRSKARVGSEVSSRDFTFKTKPEALEIISANTESLSKEKAKFNWLTSQETDTELSYTPYRNGKLSPDENKVVYDKTMTTNHEVIVSDLEAGVVYELQINAKDKRGIKINKTISFFSTTKDDLPPEIKDIQTESALSQSKDAKVQTIITWTTSEPTVSQIRYAKGVFESENDLVEETPLETVYSRKHTIVVTKFDIGEVYSFRVVATDSGGNQSVSSPHIILTPKQKEGVFELIINTFESTFGWLGQMKQ